MLKDPAQKYRPTAHHAGYANPDRAWPQKVLTAPPTWLSTDLRDGNQALFEPMNGAKKLRLFDLLVKIGFKEIEVGFPSASQTDFDFMRRLVDEKRLPADVTPMVITQAREDLIRRTVASASGARRVIVHLYNATAPTWRRIVFGMSEPEVMALIERHVRILRQVTAEHPQTEWVLQYSPETFSMTEPAVALAACQTAIETWGAGPGRPVIINLPTTVENAMPNVFADQIEWMHRRMTPREHVVLSVHPHNDRGTGVAAAELAQLAGAQRVEGCLFGNGERSGNVDLVTLALNLYTQGIHPGLDFSDINAVAREAEECTQLPIHPRHPYVGDLVYTAFSGSHQDAIKKGFAAQRADAQWEVPYLPIDPADLGRSYDGVIRVNSQSGKGGIAYLLERERGVVMPRRMLVEFSAVVQAHADASESEVDDATLWKLFEQTYLEPDGRYVLHGYRLLDNPQGQGIELDVTVDSERRRLTGVGNGPIAAAVAALGVGLRVDGYEERAIGSGADAKAMAIVEAAREGAAGSRFGAGVHENIITASVLAVLSAARRLAPAAQKLAA